MIKIAFAPSGKKADIEAGQTVLALARDLGIGIESSCGGNGQCGKCQIKIAEGEFAKFGLISASSHTNARTAAEESYARLGILKDGYRLACCTLVQDDVVIEIPASSQSQQQRVRKAANTTGMTVTENTRCYLTTVAQANLHDQDGEVELLKKALWFDYGLRSLSVSYPVLSGLQSALKAGNRRVAVVIRKRCIIAVFPQTDETDPRVYGVAFDIGSTTVAGHLLDLTDGSVLASIGQMNPQITFGDDVMARVSYVMMNADGLPKMHAAITQAISAMIAQLIAQAEVAGERVLEAVFVANPIMHHLFLGLDPTPLGQSPFVLTTNDALYLTASELGLTMAEGAKAYLLPCIAGHVGADAAAVLLSIGPEQYDGWTLAVDIGTNAEIILANKGRIYACSSPTGPAFEGAQIRCGQRAAVGAIERVMINRDSLEPSFKVIGCGLWSHEAGFAQATENLTISGICGSGIIEVMSELFLAGIINQDGVFDAGLSKKTHRVFAEGRTQAYLLYDGTADGKDGIKITVSQNDVRQIQLAKAALYAGIKLLMDKAGINQVDRIFLAGAFGSHIDVQQAMTLGIIPDCDLSQVKSVGNAAGDGAIKALLNHQERDEIESTVRKIIKIETAIEPNFQTYFVHAMALPNKVDGFPILSQSVNWPRPTADTPTDRRRRRRRRANQGNQADP